MGRGLLSKLFVVWLCLLVIDLSHAGTNFDDTLCSNIIPSPISIKIDSGYFEITEKTQIVITPEAVDASEYFLNRLNIVLGFNLPTESKGEEGKILFIIDTSVISLGKEAYRISVSPEIVTIGAMDKAGFFYAIQTLMQLLPPELAGDFRINKLCLALPCLEIRDAPKYLWRSFMLDSGRQFQPVSFIKRYLDYLAILKFNVFHWHLTEGQGWRIEIKKYPLLTEIGSKVAQGEEQQGYYTQDDIREVVTYAKKLSIMVVPEIDLPGHSEAALIAYPQYTCFGKKPETVMEYSSNIFCGGKESTYTFLSEVLDEVCELFPAPFIHLGGDEAPKDVWDSCEYCSKKISEEGLQNSHELQIYFSSRLASYLEGKGKKVILWGDIIEQNGQQLPENIVIYWWNYRKKNDLAYRNALHQNLKIICGTNYYTYLNFPVTPWSKYKIDRTFDARMMYDENPSHISDPSPLVIGMGSCLWTDWNVKTSMIDRRVFPRILILAEQMWSKTTKRPFSEFYTVMNNYYKRLNVLGIMYGPALQEDVPSGYSWE